MSLSHNHRPLRELVVDEIRNLILTGDFQPGDRILEDAIAERLGVSRNPVREAIRALEATGLIEVKARRGAYVSRLEPSEAHQLLELRSIIEAFAAERAAQNRTECGVPYRCASGNCGTDRIFVIDGHEHLSPPRKRERDRLGDLLEQGWRLACQTYASGDCAVSWDPEQKPLDVNAVDRALPNKVDERITNKWLASKDTD